jgi:hypothetical protein
MTPSTNLRQVSSTKCACLRNCAFTFHTLFKHTFKPKFKQRPTMQPSSNMAGSRILTSNTFNFGGWPAIHVRDGRDGVFLGNSIPIASFRSLHVC